MRLSKETLPKSALPVRRTRTSTENGNTLVESALIVTVFLTMLISLLDLGLILFLHLTLVERVRSAVRTAIVSGSDDTAIKNLVVYQQTSDPGTGAGFYGLTPANVRVSFAARGMADQRVTVVVTGLTYPVYTPLLASTLRNMPVQVTIPLETP